jgi:anti-sigma-K factor RskA
VNERRDGMGCEQAEELLGAYALDALPDDEAAAVRAHLATCEEHAAKAAELRAVALSLASTAEEMAPPAGLRSRVVAAVGAEGAADRSSDLSVRGQGAPVPIARGREIRERRVFGMGAPAWGAIAAALAIVAAGLLVWNVALRSDAGSADVVAVRSLTQETGATAGHVVMFDDGSMSVFGDAMPQLDASETYQIWAVSASGETTSLGLMGSDESGAAATVPFDASLGAAAIAVTVEPAGGSAAPTSEPVAVAEI